jgi:toxin ParE1/3/4
MSRYRLSRVARADLDEIWLYLARRGTPEIADRFIDTITERFALLSRQPEAGRAREEIGPGVRSFPVSPYVIYYRHDTRRGTLISRILHGRRDQAMFWSEA